MARRGDQFAATAVRLSRTEPDGAPVTAAVATAPLDELFPVPEYCPASWYLERPDWVDDWRRSHGYGAALEDSGILRLTVTDEGRVGGWFYDFGSCLLTDHGACPVPSPTRYAAFHQQDVVTDDGTVLLCGAVGNTGGHVSPYASIEEAMARYNDPRIQMIRCRVGDDGPQGGGWLAGSLVPAGARRAAGAEPLTYGHVSFLRSAALSGSWYPMPPDWWARNGVPARQVRECEGFDFIGPQLVTGPALPLATRVPRAASVGGGVYTDASGESVELRGDRPIIVGGFGGVRLDRPEACHDCTDSTPCAACADKEPHMADGARTAAAGPPQAQARTESRPAPGGGPAAGGDGQGEGELAQRVAALEQTVQQIVSHLQGAQQASIDARLDGVNRAPMPPPEGFEERSWIEYTTADLEWLEVATTGRVAAAAPSPKSAPDRPAAQRKADSQSGVALDDGSFPIRNCGDWQNAKQAVGRADPSKRAKVQAHIAARGKTLGCGNTSD